MRRQRKAKILATLGPASSDYQTIRTLFESGVDTFRLNFSHGSHADHLARIQIIRKIEQDLRRPIGILQDLQGPKLRVGAFENGGVNIKPGQLLKLDMDPTLGTNKRVCLPHLEIFAAIQPGSHLLVDDGKIRLKVIESNKNSAVTEVVVGEYISNHKGVNLPDAILPIKALTEKDISDLHFGLEHNVDWVALSFVQHAADIVHAKELIKDKAKIISKIEKPQAIDDLDQIIELSDAIMVARGDLGVEMPAEKVPMLQRLIINKCRLKGRPVVVATQMLESMIHTPTPTRAEASDVATAIYEGADAVMLSAESAAGKYPIEAVSMMNRIIQSTENDPQCTIMIDSGYVPPLATVSSTVTVAARSAANILNVPVIVTFTETGSTTYKAARERPHCDILALTPVQQVARQMSLVWGVHADLVENLSSIEQMVTVAIKMAVKHEFAVENEAIVITAGMPFTKAGGTNMLRITKIP